MSFKAAHLCAMFNGTADFFLYLYGISHARRCSSGVSQPSAWDMRPERSNRIQASSSDMNLARPTPLQSRGWKNSCLSRPKKPSARALSPLVPLRHSPLPARAARISGKPPRPAVVSAAVAAGTAGASPGASVAQTASRLEFASAASDAPRSTRRRACRRSNRSWETGSTSRRRDTELGDVGDPQPVGAPRPKPVGSVGAQGQVRRGGQRLAGVAAQLAAGRLLAVSPSSR